MINKDVAPSQSFWRSWKSNYLMCGLFISVNDSNIDFNNLLTTITHRGPDSSKTISDSNWQFGFNRLSIVENNEHDQPFRKSGSREILCFNGEIYNFRQLAADF